MAVFQDQTMPDVVVPNLGSTLELPELLNFFMLRPESNKSNQNLWGQTQASVFSNMSQVTPKCSQG